MKVSLTILPIIVLSQFCCTSLWFAGNGVMQDLILGFQLESLALGHLTSAVQFGFIAGTLVFALFTVSDRFSPSRVFFTCAVLAGLFNLGVILESNNIHTLLIFRFMVGFFLAGIYPVGMKIAADYFDKGLGKSLGYLVGALVVGTAFPHLLKSYAGEVHWQLIILATSVLSAFGGLLILLLVPDGPYRKKGGGLNRLSLATVFRNKPFRTAAIGYFGHMWELYAFWAFIPVMLNTYQAIHPAVSWDVSMYSFLIIAGGGLACVFGGFISQRMGVKFTATAALFLSGLCCLVSPLMFGLDSPIWFMFFLIFWGMMVVADSPLFSTLVAQNAVAEIKGSALTIVNCIGFSITIVSIQMINWLQSIVSPANLYLLLAIGPALGLIALMRSNEN